jgi:ADP-ribosyl-[dinitrogen reductase] hydrolase
MDMLLGLLEPLRDAAIGSPSRSRGTLLSAAAGNALGGEVEGLSAERIRARFGRVTEIPSAERESGWDDDIAQTVLLAEALLERGTLDRDDLARRLVDWFRAGARGIGMLTMQVMTELVSGTSPADAAREVWERSGRQAAGNGAVMRCSPVALRWRRAPERLVAEARASALVTHHDPRCEWSTVATVAALALTLSDQDVDVPALADALDATDAPPDVGEAIRAAAGASLEDLRLDDPASMGFTLKAMQVGLWSLRQPPDPERVLVDVVNAGGDTDTNGAVAGAVMGARVGEEGIPPRWRDAIPKPDRLAELADELLTADAGHH